MSYRVDLHIHSCYSRFDGMMSPRAILKLAEQVGYDAIAVTDHYTYDGALKGTLATQRLARAHDVHAYTGLEYHVTAGERTGHLLLYFDHVDQVPERDLTLEAVLDHARDHGLTVVHPHPYGYAGIACQQLMQAADFVELNGSYGDGPANQALRATAETLGLTGKLVANSDAHARGQMGQAFTEVEELLSNVADTLATLQGASLADPRRSWGKTARLLRAIFQPVGLAMNTVQRLTTRRALSAIGEALGELGELGDPTTKAPGAQAEG